jgi:glutamate dehydrogenase
MRVVDKEAAAVLDDVVALAASRLRGTEAARIAQFVPAYFSGVGGDDLTARTPRDLLGAALSHVRLAELRQPGEALVNVMNPDLGADGWQSDHTVVQVVTDDMEYLVESTRMAVSATGLGIHLVVHPLFSCMRNGGRLTDVAAPSASDAPNEAWIYLEVDRCSADKRVELLNALHGALADVRQALEDRDAMAEHMAALCTALADAHAGAPELAGVAGRASDFLGWLGADNYLFLGSREYSFSDVDQLVAEPIDGTGLGLLRPRPQERGRGSAVEPDRASIATINGADQRCVRPGRFVQVTVGNQRSTVLRSDYFDHVSVILLDEAGTPRGEARFIGLFREWVDRASVFEVPLIADKALEVLARHGFPEDSFGRRELRAILESLPRDELFQIDVDDLTRIVGGVMDLQDRRRVRLFTRHDEFGRFVSCFVYLPSDRFSTGRADAMAQALQEAFNGFGEEHDVTVGSGALARLHIRVDLRPGDYTAVDEAEVERRLTRIARDWTDALREALVERLGEDAGLKAFTTFGNAFPASYRDSYEPNSAVDDIARIESIAAGAGLVAAIERPLGLPPGDFRFIVVRAGSAVALSEVVPVLEHFGLHVVDERPHEIRLRGGEPIWRHDIGVRANSRARLDDSALRAELCSAFCSVFRGAVESDGFNRLVIDAALTGREVAVLRGYARYLRQTGLPFSQSYVESTLAKHPNIASLLIQLFQRRFRPDADGDREHACSGLADEIEAALEVVPSLDEDRILRSLLALVQATTRTNWFLDRPVLSFKFDAARIPDLPLPRPMFEIWVSSPRVEGVHLRAGPVARGGIRWSDRREDFRTEVLGLMKAQVVKNAVIVPTGAKGGFVVKRRDAITDPAELRAEVEQCYRWFISGLLDVTDNVVGGVIAPPDRVVRHDGDDPYFVVAADKGTATFSDIANEVAAGYGFWLGDAFASGGSAGYDHKAMAITARGAWESVRRHARTLGLDADTAEMTVVGIGDMSGDVFGNGMLRSPHLKVVGAFDHRHIFVDPDPDPARSYAERLRLAALPRSSWDDYDRSVLSPGGGVYPRSLKSIDVTPEVARRLACEPGAKTPNELICAILGAPVDLLWNGGIGTFVKASTELHSNVGDRTNDAIRIDADKLRVRMVGEGGNLGFTQLARVEYARNGGLIFTDAIDNSAGVDCSDHEVNIKILLDDQVQAGELTVKQRNDLLVSMTDEVAELVLDDNRAQTLALTISRRQASPMVDVHARYLKVLEVEKWIDRELEFLPSEKQLTERAAQGLGLTTPEFAVLLAYTKTTNTHLLLESDVPDDPYVQPALVSYFPHALRERFAAAMPGHRLRREIVATSIVNNMVNKAGTSFDHRMTEETGAGVVEVIRAHIVAADICQLSRCWDDIESLPAAVPSELQIDMFLDARRWVERCVLWLLRHRRAPLPLAETVSTFAAGMDELTANLATLVHGRFRHTVRGVVKTRVAAGVPQELAERSAVWPLLHTGLDVIELATAHDETPTDVARVYWHLFHELHVDWLWDRIGALPRRDRWETSARAAQRDDLTACLRMLTDTVVRGRGATIPAADAWVEMNAAQVDRLRAVFEEITSRGVFDLTTLSVALRQLRNAAASAM